MDIKTLQEVTENFTRELKDAAHGSPVSLSFIKNSIPQSPLIAQGQIFQSMVAGGTIFRTSLVEKTPEGLRLISISDLQQPPFDTKEGFFEFLLARLDPNVSVLALNLAFPLDPVFENGKLDGTLLYATKEHRFTGLIGEEVGKSFEAFVYASTSRSIHVSVANDTICLLLSGLIQYPANILAAGIVGTGLNFAIFQDDTTPVNLEVGGFDKFPPSEELKLVDAKSNKPGHYLFEKAIAGGYLYQHLNVQLTKQGISYTPLPASTLLTDLAKGQISQVGDMSKTILASSAQLIACAVAGIMKYNHKSMIFIMQGSLFWKGYKYKEIVKQTVKDLTDYNAEFAYIEDSDLLGAAKLVA